MWIGRSVKYGWRVLWVFVVILAPHWVLAQPATRPATAPATGPATTQAVVPFREAVETRREEPYPGLAIEYRRYEQPRPLRVWVAKIDLGREGVKLTATCGSDIGPEFETRCETTPEFAERTGVDLAINASAFHPLREKTGEPMQVVGIGACGGAVYSPPDERFGAFLVDKDGTVHIGEPPFDLGKVREALSGFHMLVDDGRDVVERTAGLQKPAFVGVNPRTAIGIDRAGRTLFLAAFDGRQKGVSEGITLYELSRFFLDLGAFDALNMDGGGSTTMVLRNPATGKYDILNTPVGRGEPNTLRLVANNLGVILPSPQRPASNPS